MLAHIKPIIKKEFRQIRRDRRTLGMLLLIPAFLLLMYGYALNFDVKHLALAILDWENNQGSRDFCHRFLHSEYFDMKYQVDSLAEIDRLMGEGKIQVALVVPTRFAERAAQGETVRVQALVNGEQVHVAAAVIGYINAITQAYSAEKAKTVLAQGRISMGPPIAPQPRIWFNPELRSSRFLIPGLMAFILMIIVVVSTAFSVVREKEKGSLERIMISPVKPAELILGKTVPYVLISLVSSHLVLLLGRFLFGVSIEGNYALLLLGMVFFLVGGLGLGLFISTIAHTQQVAFLLAIITTLLPTFVLSGFVFPIRNMPAIIQALTFLIPARHFLFILRGLMLKGVGIEAFWSQMLFLVVFAALTLILSSVRLGRALRRGTA